MDQFEFEAGSRDQTSFDSSRSTDEEQFGCLPRLEFPSDGKRRDYVSAGASADNHGSHVESVRVLRDVEENADAGEADEDRRAAVGDKRQWDAFGRQQAQHNTDVEERLQDHHAGNPNRKKAPIRIARTKRRANAAIAKDAKEQYDEARADQSQFLRNYGEDEVGVRLGKLEKLLLSLHQPESGQPAGAHRNQRLDDMEAASLPIGPGIDERQHTITTPTYAEEQEVK